MIDPIEALITYIENDAGMIASIGTQVAGKHQFGSGWALPSKALAIRSDGGQPDIYTERQTLRIEARCYGASQATAMSVSLALVTLTRSLERVTIAVTGGNALIYWLNVSSGPSLLYDREIDIDYVMLFLDTAIAETAVL